MNTTVFHFGTVSLRRLTYVCQYLKIIQSSHQEDLNKKSHFDVDILETNLSPFLLSEQIVIARTGPSFSFESRDATSHKAMVESAFCNGSQRINATIADFADYNATLRLLLPYFLLACSAFSVLWNFGVIIQFAIHRFRRIPNKFDFFLFFTSFAELLSSTLIVTFAGIGSGFSRNYSETDAVKNTDNGDEVTPYIIVSVFAFFRLYAILVYSPILINRFYSAKFPSEREFSLAVPREASPNGSFRFWVGNLVALSGAIALAVKGGDVSQNMYSCFYIMTKW